MESVRNTVCYCCIWKDGRVLYSYSIGDHGIDNLAALCLESIPPYHRWYLETIGKHTFGFFMKDDGCVYFAIVRESFGNSQLVRFLEKLKDEFTRIGKRGGSTTSLDSLCLVPVVHHLVASLQRDTTVWPSPSPASTKPPLLAKKKTRDIEMERIDSGPLDTSNDQGSPLRLHNKWCRQVRIVLAIDAAVCVVLFIIWLVICRGIVCLR